MVAAKIPYPPPSEIPKALLYVAFIVGALALLTGCGGQRMTPQEFLLAEQTSLGQVDFTKYEEVDFGRFKTTHVEPTSRSSTIVQFNLWAVVRPGKGEAIRAIFEANQQRIRDRVIVIIQNTQLDQLTEPSLESLKYDLLPVIRESLRTADLRDIVLDDFRLSPT